MDARSSGLGDLGKSGPRPWYERIHENEAAPRPAVSWADVERRRNKPSQEQEPRGPKRVGCATAWRVLPVLIALAGLGAGFVAGTRADYFESLTTRFDGAKFTAMPHFLLERFRAVRPGMTEEELRDLIGIPVERYGGMGGAVAWRYTVPARPGPAPYRLCSVIVDPDTGRVLNTVERGWKRYNIWQPAYAFLCRRVGSIRLTRPGQAPLVVSANDPNPHLLIVASAQTIRGEGGADVLQKQREYNDAGLQAHVIAVDESSGLTGAYSACSRNLKPWVDFYSVGRPFQVLVYERGTLYYAAAASSHLYPGQTNGDEAWLIDRLRASGARPQEPPKGLHASRRVSS